MINFLKFNGILYPKISEFGAFSSRIGSIFLLFPKIPKFCGILNYIYIASATTIDKGDSP